MKDFLFVVYHEYRHEHSQPSHLFGYPELHEYHKRLPIHSCLTVHLQDSAQQNITTKDIIHLISLTS